MLNDQRKVLLYFKQFFFFFLMWRVVAASVCLNLKGTYPYINYSLDSAGLSPISKCHFDRISRLVLLLFFFFFFFFFFFSSSSSSSSRNNTELQKKKKKKKKTDSLSFNTSPLIRKRLSTFSPLLYFVPVRPKHADAYDNNNGSKITFLNTSHAGSSKRCWNIQRRQQQKNPTVTNT